MKLALASDFPATPNDAVCSTLRAGGSNPRIAWLSPATPARAEHFARAVREFRALGFWRLDCIAVGDGALGAPAARLDDYDAVYLSGGDPIAFRSDLLRSGLVSPLHARLRSGRCIVAASGGAMQFTENLSLFRLASVPEERVISDHARFAAMAALPIELLPHLNRQRAPFLEQVARYSQRVGADVLALADGAALLRDDAGERIVGEALRFRRGEREEVGAP